MITVEEKTTIVGVAELRKAISDILEKIKSNKVILTRGTSLLESSLITKNIIEWKKSSMLSKITF